MTRRCPHQFCDLKQAFVESFKPSPRTWDIFPTSLAQSSPSTATAVGKKADGIVGDPCRWMIDSIASEEKQAERSLMHRFDTAHRLVEQVAQHGRDAEEALKVILVWLR